LTDFVCLYNYEFWLSLCKIVRSSVILLLPFLTTINHYSVIVCLFYLCRRSEHLELSCADTNQKLLANITYNYIELTLTWFRDRDDNSWLL